MFIVESTIIYILEKLGEEIHRNTQAKTPSKNPTPTEPGKTKGTPDAKNFTHPKIIL